MNGLLQGFVLPCVCAFVGCLGFSVLYNIRGNGILICAFGGLLGWLCYLLAAPLGSEIVQCFLAAVTVSLYAEIMARIRRCPVTAYLLVALFPLVPGGGIYYSMEHAMSGETALFITTLLHTLGLAGALAVGVLTVASLVRLWMTVRKKLPHRR